VGVAALLISLMAVGGGAAAGGKSYARVCPAPPAGYAACLAEWVTTPSGSPFFGATPRGYTPTQIKSLYSLPTSFSAGGGETVGIVDAFDDPAAESDLAVFTNQFGLPACTTANGCFTKVDQSGGTNYPRTDFGWAAEISLDIQWAHAIAPGAKILLVEATTNSLANLLAAEDYAKTHAQYVSNSWGGSEFSGETTYDSHFAQPGVSFFVSSGDAGLPAEYPSASPNVISVGGTSLNSNPFPSTNFVSETGWSGSGGGCSAYETANPAQAAFSQYGQVNCGGARATPDVSLVADPNTGVAIYDSLGWEGFKGWIQIGGTSASSPMWAARSADSGSLVDAPFVYGNQITYRDITQGNNGAPALVGYDLVTGRGSWIGKRP
jgi:subtilase family serine protease